MPRFKARKRERTRNKNIHKELNASKIPKKSSKLRLRNLLLGEIPRYLSQRAGGDMGICMSMSWIVSECLNLYNIKCKPRRVRIILGDSEARKILSEEGQVVLNEKMSADPSIWTIGLGFPDGKLKDSFHVVIHVERDDSVIDLTAKQASRPNRGLIVKNYWSKLDNLPSFILKFEFIKGKITQGQLINHPNIIEIVNYVSKRIANTLEVKPQKISPKYIKKLRNEAEGFQLQMKFT